MWSGDPENCDVTQTALYFTVAVAGSVRMVVE